MWFGWRTATSGEVHVSLEYKSCPLSLLNHFICDAILHNERLPVSGTDSVIQRLVKGVMCDKPLAGCYGGLALRAMPETAPPNSDFSL